MKIILAVLILILAGCQSISDIQYKRDNDIKLTDAERWKLSKSVTREKKKLDPGYECVKDFTRSFLDCSKPDRAPARGPKINGNSWVKYNCGSGSVTMRAKDAFIPAKIVCGCLKRMETRATCNAYGLRR